MKFEYVQEVPNEYYNYLKVAQTFKNIIRNSLNSINNALRAVTNCKQQSKPKQLQAIKKFDKKTRR